MTDWSEDQVQIAEILGTRRKVARQARSGRSAQMALAAACELLRERESASFTLNDVSLRAKVSIGSIINRFACKDNLIRAAVLASLDEYGEVERSSIEIAATQASSLTNMVERFVDIVAVGWARYSIALNSAVYIAQTDQAVRCRLDAQAARSEEALVNGILRFRREIEACSPRSKARFVNNVVRSVVSSNAGHDQPLVAIFPSQAPALKDQLVDMCVGFLQNKQW